MFIRILFTVFSIFLLVVLSIISFFNEDDSKDILTFYKGIFPKSGKKIDIVKERSLYDYDYHNSWPRVNWSVTGGIVIVSLAVGFLLGLVVYTYRHTTDGDSVLVDCLECIYRQLSNFKMQVDSLEERFNEMEQNQPTEELKPNINVLEEEFAPLVKSSLLESLETRARDSQTDGCPFSIIGQTLDSEEKEDVDDEIILQQKSESMSCNTVSQSCANNTNILYSSVLPNISLSEENSDDKLMIKLDQEHEIKNNLNLVEEISLDKTIYEGETCPIQIDVEKCSSKVDKEKSDEKVKINILTGKPTVTILGAVRDKVGDHLDRESSMPSCRKSKSYRTPLMQKHKASDSKLESVELQEHQNELGTSQRANLSRNATDVPLITRRKPQRNIKHSN